MSNYSIFLDNAKKYVKLVGWCAGPAAAIPFAAHQAGLTPPWPVGIVLLTALWQLIAIVLFFQIYSDAKKSVFSKLIKYSVAILVISSIFYFYAQSALLYIGPAGGRFVKGFACTNAALSLDEYRETCPLLNDVLINSSESAERLWTPASISAARLLLLVLWMLAYLPIAFCLFAFVTFQSGIGGRRRPPRPRT